MKKFATIAGSLALFAVTVLPALAVGNNCENGTTGPYATNYCTINNTSKVDVDNVNDAVIKNNITNVSNTGNNTASYNTLGGSIRTGNATLNSTTSNIANVNTTTVSGGPASSSNNGLNEVTGPYSDNNININNKRNVDVWNSNTATVDNNVNNTANSGDNAADYNTGPAMVTTGNTALRTVVATHANDNATAVSAGAGGAGGNSAANDTTGPFSTDYVTIRNKSKIDVDNVNDMVVNNTVDTLAKSGGNSASYTTLGGDIGTGFAGSNTGVNTEGNINTTTITAAMGGFANDGSNGITGPFSDNRTELLNSQKIEVENWNNKCKSHNSDRLGDPCDPADLGVFNTVNDTANTGDNAADYNTGGGGVLTGISDLLKSVMIHMNDTLTLIQQ